MKNKQITINNEQLIKKECSLKAKRDGSRHSLRTTTLFPIICYLLFVISGCRNYDLPFRAKLVITITDTGNNEIPDGGDIYFNVGGASKTFLASVSGAEGDDIVSVAWTLIKGSDVITLTETGDGANITPKAIAGDAKIRVTAANKYDVSTHTDLNVYVNPVGYDNWTFKIMDESKEIYDKDEFDILPEATKELFLDLTTGDPVTLSAVGSAGTVAAVSAVSGSNSFTITALQYGRVMLTIKALKGTQEITKTITVFVAEPGVLFAWDNTILPMTQINSGAAVYGGYRDVYMAARRAAIEAPEDAIRLGTAGGDGNLLVIGSGSGTGSGSPAATTTSSTVHIPGQFDFSTGTFRLTIDYKDVSFTNDVLLRICINNNGRGYDNSVLGGNSTVHNAGSVDALHNNAPSGPGLSGSAVPGQLILIITPSVRFTGATNGILMDGLEVQAKESLKTGFIALQAYQGNFLTITGIKLERVQ